MRHAPSIGEVTGAIILTATFAIASSILYVTFQEKAEQIQHIQYTYTTKSAQRATELLDVDMVQCNGGFILHNYSTHDVYAKDFTMYGNDTKTAIQYSISFYDLNGKSIDVIPAQNSVWVSTRGVPCGVETILMTPGGSQIEVYR